MTNIVFYFDSDRFGRDAEADKADIASRRDMVLEDIEAVLGHGDIRWQQFGEASLKGMLDTRADLYAIDFGGASITGDIAGECKVLDRLRDLHPGAFILFITEMTYWAYERNIAESVGELINEPNIAIWNWRGENGWRDKVSGWLGR